MPSRFIVRTLGCKANLADGDRLEAELARRGWLRAGGENPGGADLCIVNSCTVTDEADRQSRKLASRLSRENPAAVVVVTGCAAEVDPERIAGTPGVHYVIGNRSKPELVSEILSKLELPRPERGVALGRTSGYSEILSRHPIDREWPSMDLLSGAEDLGAPGAHTRAFLKIQEGCNSFCTYCIIPYGRGPSRSLGVAEVVEAVRAARSNGAREIILTGTNIGDYGADWSDRPELESLIRELLRSTAIERIRLSSLDPTEITDGILELVEAEERICAHFHVSLQSVSDRVLKLMKRRYGYREIERCLTRIAGLRPASAAFSAGGCFVGMDVITGFPGETSQDFEESLGKFRELPWSRLHVFPYSERAGTPATRLPGSVPQAERVARARVLQRLSAERVSEWVSARVARGQGAPIPAVLLERPYRGSDGRTWVAGLTPDYVRVAAPLDSAGADLERNQLVSIRPLRVELREAAGEAVVIGEF